MMKLTTDMMHRDLRKYANVFFNNQPLLNSITAIRERDRNLKRKFYGKWFGKKTHMEEQEILRNDGSSLRICIVYPNHFSKEESICRTFPNKWKCSYGTTRLSQEL